MGGPDHMKNALSHSMVLDLLMLDDWGKLAKFALPLIMKYGAPVVKKLYH